MSDADSALNKPELIRCNVRFIVNCASEDVDNMFEDDSNYSPEYLSFPCEDTHDSDPSEYFEPLFEFVSKAKEQNKSDSKSQCLIHCTYGKNISPTFVVAYMMMSSQKQNKHLPLSQALKYVTSKYPGVQLQQGMLNSLINLEEQLFEETSMTKVGVKSHNSARGQGNLRGGRGGKGKRGK